MAKLKCHCGHIIVDQSDNLPYKGYIISDTELESVSSVLTDAIDSLSTATQQSKRLEWIKGKFAVPPYPIDISDSAMIHDIISDLLVDKKQDIFECENCGRIAIEVGQTNHFKFYKPEHEDAKGILGGQNLQPT